MIANYPSVTSWTDRIDGTDTVMAADINQLYAETIATENALTTSSTLVTSFYLSADTSANDMIERALASSPTYKKLVLPVGEYTTIRPIVIPDGVSFVGCGSSTVLKPDFSQWQGTDYRVVILRGKEGINKNYNSYNKIVGDFSISGVNSASVKAIGVFVGTDQTIPVGSAVNYAMVNGLIRNIYVEQLDTGFWFKEFDQSDAINIQSMYCRVGVLLAGKSVNANFECKLYNTSTAFTTDTTDVTMGFDIEQVSTYSGGVVGRPEGIFIQPGTLIYGYHNNLVINSVLQCTVSGCMFDGGTDTCFVTGGLNVDGLTATRNWFYTSSSTASCILINANAGNTNSSITLDSNRIVGATGAKGIECNNHYFLNITKNDISGFSSPIWCNSLFNCNILNNHGHSNNGEFIYNQSYGDGGFIDGNTTTDAYKVVVLQPSTGNTLQVGKNFSANSCTYYRGKAVIAAGQTSTSCGDVFGAITNADYIFPIVNFQVYNSALTTQVVSWAQASNQITFTMSTTSSTVTNMYYEVIAIPYSLF